MVYKFRTIAAATQAEFKDRGSKFLAFAYPVQHTDEAKKWIQILKKEHPKANHHCFAYRIGTDGLQFRVGDDGEPSGSAGRPIIGQIDSKELTNVLIVVVRYFGGVLLGVPGLINAYKSSALACLEVAEVVEKDVEIEEVIEFDYTLLNEVMMILKQNNINTVHQEMQLFCRFTISIPLEHYDKVKGLLRNIHGLTIIEINKE